MFFLSQASGFLLTSLRKEAMAASAAFSSALLLLEIKLPSSPFSLKLDDLSHVTCATGPPAHAPFLEAVGGALVHVALDGPGRAVVLRRREHVPPVRKPGRKGGDVSDGLGDPLPPPLASGFSQVSLQALYDFPSLALLGRGKEAEGLLREPQGPGERPRQVEAVQLSMGAGEEVGAAGK